VIGLSEHTGNMQV